MSAIHYKTIKGIEYAYEVESFWDKALKKNRKRTTYLGRVVDKVNKTYERKKDKKRNSEKQILSFGDTYCIFGFFKQTQYFKTFQAAFSEEFDTLMSLICFRISCKSAMQYAQAWAEGNYARILFKNANLSSQRISDFLKYLGEERVQRTFFTQYLSLLSGKPIGTLIDSTGLPNEIDFPLNAWGRHGNVAESETRLLFVVDRSSGMPLYFRYMAGNIVDVSTLSTTITELSQCGIDTDFSIVDAGYYSEKNIKALYKQEVAFLTRLPSNRKMYKDLIAQYGDGLESAENAVIYGDRVLYVRCVPIDMFGKQGFAYVVLDPKRYADESGKFLISALEDKMPIAEINTGLKRKGKLIFVSSTQIAVTEIIPLYYTRQTVENIFGIAKDNLELLPLRIHSLETFRGYIMLSFLALIVQLSLQKKLDKKFTIEDFLYTTRNLMCKVYDNDIIIQELSKKCSDIFRLLAVKVVNFLGV
jgi:hypothetical protein